MGSSFGTLFKITTWGESHGGGVGVVVDGCPSLIPITEEEIQVELDRRRPGQSKIVTRREESDRVRFMSGVLDGQTLGSPIMMMVLNEDTRSKDYDEMRDEFRPSHADYTYDEKYGIRAWQGGGRASARETIGRVAAGALAKKLLRVRYGVEVLAWVEKVHHIRAEIDPLGVTSEQVESNIVRCPDVAIAEKIVKLIESVRKDGDSVGGIISCVVKECPAGWGEPVFDKLEADLAKALLSIPACRGFEVGSGFSGTDLKGSEHNDLFFADRSHHVYTKTNYSGGIQGGISNGQPILLKAAFKPTATILMEQHTIDRNRENTTLKGRGRHDPCVLPRAVPIVEAMVALVLADHALRQDAMSPKTERL